MSTHDLITAIAAGLAAGADPGRAAGQQRYMRSSMPFHGLTVPQVRLVVAAAVASHPPADRAAWLGVIRDLWDGATHREQWYAALGVLRHRRFRAWASVADEPRLSTPGL